jgi:hypothetical protein
MNDGRFDPDDFPRVLALPEDHPERIRAERSPRFQAWKHMLAEFESPGDVLLSPEERSAAEGELAGRVERVLPARPAARVGERRAESIRVRDARGPTAWFSAWLRAPAWKPALAVAAVAIVATLGWWSFERVREPGVVRGVGGATAAFDLRAAPGRDGLALTWPAVPDADAYRVVFYGADLAERARVDGLPEPRMTLRAGALPAGLGHGETALAEVTALRRGDAIATSRMTSVRVP